MNTFKLIAIFVFGLSASSVMATSFSPEINAGDGTYEEVDFFFFSLPANYTVGVFDASDVLFSTPLMIQTGDAVSFSPNPPGPGPYTAENIVSNLSINLGASPDFMLALFDTNTNMWIGDDGVNPLNVAGTAFNVFFNTAPGVITSVDLVLSEIPVPAAVWLFGSGLLGLVGVARRRA